MVASHATQAAPHRRTKYTMSERMLCCEPVCSTSLDAMASCWSNMLTNSAIPQESANAAYRGIARSWMGASSKFTAPLIEPSTAGGILRKIGSGFTITRQNPRHSIVHAGTGNIPVCRPRQIAAARSLELRQRIGRHRFSVHQAATRLKGEAAIRIDGEITDRSYLATRTFGCRSLVLLPEWIPSDFQAIDS